MQARIRGHIERRRYLESKAELKRLQEERRAILEQTAALTIQHFMKGYIVRCKYKRVIHSVTTIQAYWRGYKQRQVKEAWCKRIQEVRRRVRKAQQNVTEEKKLCNRTVSALDFLYTSKDMANLIKVLRDLDVATRYSPFCCIRLIENNGMALSILANLAERCNRSLPHMEVVTTVCDILISISELEETRNFVATSGKCGEILTTIFHLMRMHCKDNKKSLYIFSKCCSFLWKLCHHQTALTILCTKEYSEKLTLFEKDLRNQKNRLTTTSSGTSLQNFTPFRARSNSAPQSTKKATKQPQKILTPKHGAAELSPTIVRFHEDYATAISSLNKKIKRSNVISE